MSISRRGHAVALAVPNFVPPPHREAHVPARDRPLLQRLELHQPTLVRPTMRSTETSIVWDGNAHFDDRPLFRHRNANDLFGQGRLSDNPFRSWGTPVSTCVVPKSSTACARRRPHVWPSAPPRHVLCSVRAGTENAILPATPVVLSLQPTAEGVLPGQLLERAIRAGYIDAGRFNIPDANVQPASLDLRLGERALRIRCSFLPGADSVERKLKDYILDEIDLRGDGAMLEARCPYLIELKERLDLPGRVAGEGQPQELDWPDRRVHPGHHRPQRPVRRSGAGLPGPSLPGGGAALIRRPGPRGPDPQPAAPLHGPALAHRRRSAPGTPHRADPLQAGRAGAGRRPRALQRRPVPRPGPPRRRAGTGGLQHPRQCAVARSHHRPRDRPCAVLGPRLPRGGRSARALAEALLSPDVARGGEHPPETSRPR